MLRSPPCNCAATQQRSVTHQQPRGTRRGAATSPTLAHGPGAAHSFGQNPSCPAKALSKARREPSPHPLEQQRSRQQPHYWHRVGLQINGTQVAFVQPHNLQRRSQGGIGSSSCTCDPGVSSMRPLVSTSTPVRCVQTPNLMHTQAKVHMLCASICTRL